VDVFDFEQLRHNAHKQRREHWRLTAALQRESASQWRELAAQALAQAGVCQHEAARLEALAEIGNA
jgi:hypothetical protein